MRTVYQLDSNNIKVKEEDIIVKRRVVAVTLSLIMTMATVSETGAAVFTSPEIGRAHV